MKATTVDGGIVEIVPEMLDNLKMCLRGQVIFAGGRGYDACQNRLERYYRQKAFNCCTLYRFCRCY